MENSKQTKVWKAQGYLDKSLAKRSVNHNDFEDLLRASSRDDAAVRFGRSRSGEQGEIAISVCPDDLVEVELQDGLIFYLSVDRFEAMVSPDPTRSAEEELLIPEAFSPPGYTTRGFGEFVLKSFRVLNIEGELAKKTVLEIAEKLEQRLINNGGLYRWDHVANNWGESDQTPVDVSSDAPVLILLHGTASSTEGSFKDLWSATHQAQWKKLLDAYGQEIYAFEHKTITCNPIENAIELVSRLAIGTRVHLLSHSRGGLVGELLCRGELMAGSDSAPFNEDDRSCFDPDKNTSLFKMLKEFAENGPKYYQTDDTGASDCLNDLTRLGNLLIEKKIVVERFIRVACPIRGTTLASERLDLFLSGVLNLVGLVSGLRTNPVYGFLQALAIAVAKERTNPQTLPGLEAMMPGSPLIRMLNTRQTKTHSHLAVIKGDIQPSGVFKRLGILMADAFYSGDHDLVVDSDSMEGGVARNSPGVLFLRGKDVNHFSYFQNAKSVQNIVSALLEKKLPDAYTVNTGTREISRSFPREGLLASKPVLFLLPGIAGSTLSSNNERIWVDLIQLIKGNFESLRIGQPVLSERCNKDFYGDLVSYLRRTHEVIAFHYDWRLSILDASERLANEIDAKLTNTDSNIPIRIIGHSMGGLVARGMIAKRPEIWQRMIARRESRLLMLGTPNQGSYSMLKMLIGEDSLTQILSFIDIKYDQNKWLGILREFPGVLELLPRHGDQDCFSSTLWTKIESCLHFKPEDSYDALRGSIVVLKNPDKDALNSARNTCEKIDAVDLDPKYVMYIAGKAGFTPDNAMIINDSIKFSGTSEGDGRVPWAHGIPKNLKCWYVDAEHGDLANFSPSFAGIVEIITTGDTSELSDVRPTGRSRSVQGEERFPMKKGQVTHFPNEQDLIRSIMGGSGRSPEHVQPQSIQLKVSVSHGNLRFARSPVVAGHYIGDSIVSAEAMLDWRLKGRLSDRHKLGLYPGEIGTNEVLLERDHTGKPSGAVIVGLGKVGALSAGDISATFRDAILKYVLTWVESECFADQPITISSLLIGIGQGGIPVEDALAAMLRGLYEANHHLRSQKVAKRKAVLSIEFIELYEETAALAQRILLRFQKRSQFQDMILVNPTLREAEGGRRRIAFSDDQNWWERIQIRRDKSEGLKFTYLTKRARAETSVVAQQRCTVDAFLAQATQSTFSDSRWSRTLFELLIPRDFKYHIGDQKNLLLILDDDAAEYPWELLEYEDDRGTQAPAIQAGLIRQLITHEYQTNPILCTEKRALIVGDPPSSLAELPGAQNEARSVNSKLITDEYKTELMIESEGLDILSALMSGKYKILHLAGHGVFNEVIDTKTCELKLSSMKPENFKKVTGMVLGKNLYLTAAEIAQMPVIPELVFINCCHLGNTSEPRPALTGNRYRLAANISTELIRAGIKVVIAAGWEVSDEPAGLFASSFYSSMLEGETFGDAVLHARQTTRKRYPSSNTWGAYQCYGDPNYRLTDTGSQRNANAETLDFVCKNEVVIELDNLYSAAKTADDEQADQLVVSLSKIEEEIPTDWKDDASIQAALGKAYGELDQFEKAINAYKQAASSEQVDISLKAMEQKCNFEVRYAGSLHPEKPQQAKTLIKEALERLDDIAKVTASGSATFEDTIERWCLRGSAYKRSAMLTNQLADLKKMRDAYKTADDLSILRQGKVNAYPRLNWLAARLILSRRSKAKVFSDLNDFEEKLLEVKKVADNQQNSTESFWNDIINIECHLLESLFQHDLEEAKPKIIKDFLNQKKKAVSPRQLRSVMENLEFLIQMLPNRPQFEKEEKEVLKKIKRQLK